MKRRENLCSDRRSAYSGQIAYIPVSEYLLDAMAAQTRIYTDVAHVATACSIALRFYKDGLSPEDLPSL